MLIALDHVLTRHEAAALREAAAGLDFEDGRRTAGRYARGVKHNEQAADTPQREAILAKVRRALEGHETFRLAARPRRFARTLVSRYGPGMEFGLHVDDPIQQGSRTDLSFTLFLSPADSYEGGGLVLQDAIEERVLKLEAGSAILYPTSALHQVEPVTEGERIAVVGWVTSWVRDPGRREVLYDLDLAAKGMFDALGKNPDFDRLHKAKANLYRMWADD